MLGSIDNLPIRKSVESIIIEFEVLAKIKNENNPQNDDCDVSMIESVWFNQKYDEVYVYNSAG